MGLKLHPDAEKFRAYMVFNRAPSTVYNYSRNVSRFLTWVDKPLEEIEAMDITDWYESLLEDGLKPRSVWRFGWALRAFFDIMGMKELELRTPIMAYEVPDPLWLDKSQTMGVVAGVPVLCVGYALALRVGEVRYLTRRRFDQDTGQIEVKRLKHKGRRNTYILQLEPWCLEVLNKHLEETEGPRHGDAMFKMSVSTIQGRFNARAAALGLDPKYSFHCLRHSKVTHLALQELEENGVVDELSLSKFAGHLRVETTRMYVHLAARHLAFKS